MIPIVSILYFLLKFKKVFNQREQVYSKTTLITTIIICIFISTLMENVSAGFTATLAIFNLYFFIKNKKINKLLFISLLSSLVGSIFMFTSPGIRLSRELYNHSLGIVSTFKNSLFSNISLIIFQNKFIFLIITLITIVAINTNSINIKHKLIKYLYLSFVFLILFILSVSVVNNYIFIPQKIMSLTYYFFSRRFLVSFFWLTFLLSFIIPVLYIIRNKKIFLFLLSVAIFSLIPASLITQTGARIIAIIVFIMIGISSGFYSKIESNKLTFWLICFGIIVQSNKLLTIYHDIYKTQKIRQNVIDNTIILQHQQKWDYDQPLILPAFKTNHLLYNANPPPLNTSGHYLNFIRFYNLNPKTKVIFDDGFAYLNLNFKLNKNNESIIEIKPLENKYKYLFYIYKDGIEYFKSNYSNQTFIKINLNDPGKYTARCDMNLDGKVKTAYTDDYIIIN